MSDYDKAQNFSVYDYNTTTRSEAPQDYRAFDSPRQTYNPSYVGNPTQVPSGLPQSTAAFHPHPTAQQYGTHDPAYYAPQNVQYIDPASAPRPLPEIVSYSPVQGLAGTRVAIQIRSLHNLDLPPVAPVIMFGQKRCQGVMSKLASQPSTVFQYSLSVDAPPLTPTSTPSPQVPLSLTFEDSSINWQNPSVEFGRFTYVDSGNFYPANPTAQVGSMKKRKLDADASPRRSPTKKPSMHHLSGAVPPVPALTPSSPFRKPSHAPYSSNRRFSGSEHQPTHQPRLRSVQSQYFPSKQTTPSLHAPQTPTWSPLTLPQKHAPNVGIGKSSLLPSPSTNPALVRTSTLQSSPPPPVPPLPNPSFNPYSMYPANAKAMLKIDGDLNTMTQKWTSEEWEAGRRLVQFRRSQQGSVITATFEPVTLEDRIPNSICVSCIWWAEREECFVTSVDTISLLESLVAVRFTVEEKNRIRRNLEGFRPLTVSKTKQESDDFFKLIMGFPNPKPRNIEKDVKVFPWRILNTALKKIIGKYSASYSSTAGALHATVSGPPSYAGTRTTDHGFEQQSRPGASPLSTSSSATSHGHVYAANMAGGYPMHPGVSTGLGIASPSPTAGAQDLRLAAPLSIPAPNTSWAAQQPPSHYPTEMPGRAPWDLSGTFYQPPPPSAMSHGPPVVGMPDPVRPPPLSFPPHHQQHAMPMPVTSRFVPLDNYGGGQQQSQQTSNA